MIVKSLSRIFLTVFVFMFLCTPFFCTIAETGNVAVATTVPSKVSKSNSTVTQNVKEVLADGVQKAVITVTLHNATDNPLTNLKVVLSSNRGEIDTINALSGIDKTNVEGMVYFEVSSSVPGEAVFTPLADSLVVLDSVNITFLPLPFPKNVTISVEVPKVINPSGKIDILTPSKEPFASSEGGRLVNMGVDIKIPLWLVLVFLTSVLMNIALFLLVIVMIFRLRKTTKKEEQILEKEEEVLEKIEKNEDSNNE